MAIVGVAGTPRAEAVYNGYCYASIGNGYYSYYWAASTSNDYDCYKLGVAFGDSGTSYDSSHPFNIDRVSATEPGGSTSMHLVCEAYNDCTLHQKYYTWL
jgi:hypothetical protein